MRCKIKDICKPKQWKTISAEMLQEEGYPVYGANGVIGYYSEYNHENPTLLVTCRGATCGSLNICQPYSYVNGNAMALDELRSDVNIKYLYYYLNARGFNDVISGSAQPQITRSAIEQVEIEVKSEAEQKEVVNKLELVESMISAGKEQLLGLDNLIKSRFVEMFGDTVMNSMKWEEHFLNEYVTFLTSGSRGWAQYYTDECGEVFITIKNVKNNHISLDNVQYINAPNNKEAQRTKVQTGDLLISITADLGRTGVVEEDIATMGAYINQHLSLVRLDSSKINPLYVSYFLETDGGKRQFESKNQNGVKAGLNFDAIKSLKILVPPLELQNDYLDFVASVDKLKVAYT